MYVLTMKTHTHTYAQLSLSLRESKLDAGVMVNVKEDWACVWVNTRTMRAPSLLLESH